MFAQLALIGAIAIAFGTPSDSECKFALNHAVDAVDPYFGAGKFIYVKHDGSAIPNGSLIIQDADGTLTACPSTANMGAPVFVAVSNFAAGSTTPQYGWIMSQGLAPCTFSVAATTGAVYIGTAGNMTPTAAAGKQILGARTEVAASGTLTKTGQTRSGLKQLQLTDLNGLYVGQAVSGTGIAGSSVIAALNPDNSVTLNNAMTASASVTITFTHTGYGLVRLSNPHTQSAIT